MSEWLNQGKRNQARNMLVKSLCLLRPDLAEELRDEMVPLILPILDHLSRENAVGAILNPEYPQTFADIIDPARTAIRAWSERHNIIDDWLVEEFLRLAMWWATHPETAAKLSVRDHTAIHFHELEDVEYSTHDGWCQGWESWEDFEKRAAKSFRYWLRHEYKDLYPDEVKQREGKAIGDHIEWLVRSRFGGETLSEIGADVGRSPSTIGDGIRAAAKLIG